MGMSFRRKKCPQQNTENTLRMLWVKKCLTKECGQVNLMVGLFLILFLAIYLWASLQITRYRTASLYLEDALAASNLASAVVDLQEYGISHRIVISDPYEAFEQYKSAVKGNLNLDNSWLGSAGGVVQGKVTIENYTVYNVKGERVFVYSFDESGNMTQWEDTINAATAPNGIKIENTSVYSRISFPVEAFPGIIVEARKGKVADITR